MWWNDYWPMPMFFGLPIMLVIMIFCLVMMFVMMRGMRHRSRNGYAAEILKERFARGEINRPNMTNGVACWRREDWRITRPNAPLALT